MEQPGLKAVSTRHASIAESPPDCFSSQDCREPGFCVPETCHVPECAPSPQEAVSPTSCVWLEGGGPLEEPSVRLRFSSQAGGGSEMPFGEEGSLLSLARRVVSWLGPFLDGRMGLPWHSHKSAK